MAQQEYEWGGNHITAPFHLALIRTDLMKASTIIMTPDVLQAKSLWEKEKKLKIFTCLKETGTFTQRKGR